MNKEHNCELWEEEFILGEAYPPQLQGHVESFQIGSPIDNDILSGASEDGTTKIILKKPATIKGFWKETSFPSERRIHTILT